MWWARRTIRLADWRRSAGRVVRTFIYRRFSRWTWIAQQAQPTTADQEPQLRDLEASSEVQHRATLVGAAALIATIGEDRGLRTPTMVCARLSGGRYAVIPLLKSLCPELQGADDQDQRGLASLAEIVTKFDPADDAPVAAGRQSRIRISETHFPTSR